MQRRPQRWSSRGTSLILFPRFIPKGPIHWALCLFLRFRVSNNPTMRSIFAKKTVEQILAESEGGEHKLKRTLNVWSLIAIGIGCIIGTGIFVLTGKVAIENSGPGIMLSFIICGVACILAALCYAEFASFIPIAGSAYTYSFATMGEVVAWVIGWDLILEYGLSTSAVAGGWSSHFVNFLDLVFGVEFPKELALTPADGGYANVPAMFISLAMTTLLITGIKESARFNNIIVVIKLAVAFFFIGVGLIYVNPDNWSPFIPAVKEASSTGESVVASVWDTPLWKIVAGWFGSSPTSSFGGVSGIVLGAATIFFAYIGFDAVSTTAEEAENPSRDVPRGIIWSLIIATILYILMSMVFTGIVRCDGTLTMEDLGTDAGAPLVYAFKQVPNSMINKWAAILVDLGGLAGITSVLLVTLLGQSRIFYSMSRDRLLPPWIAKIHPRFQTPYVGTLITGIAVSFVSGFVPLGTIAEMANMGTLFAFVLVSGGILVLRKTQPDRIAPFRTPFVPFTPIIAILFCVGLMISLPLLTWTSFFVWMGIGMVVYFMYSHKNAGLPKK